MERRDFREWISGLSLPDLCGVLEDLEEELGSRDFKDLAHQLSIVRERLSARWSPIRVREPE